MILVALASIVNLLRQMCNAEIRWLAFRFGLFEQVEDVDGLFVGV